MLHQREVDEGCVVSVQHFLSTSQSLHILTSYPAATPPPTSFDVPESISHVHILQTMQSRNLSHVDLCNVTLISICSRAGPLAQKVGCAKHKDTHSFLCSFFLLRHEYVIRCRMKTNKQYENLPLVFGDQEPGRGTDKSAKTGGRTFARPRTDA